MNININDNKVFFYKIKFICATQKVKKLNTCVLKEPNGKKTKKIKTQITREFSEEFNNAKWKILTLHY